MTKTGKIIALALALGAGLSGVWLFLSPAGTENPVAVIEQDGAELYRIPLNEVDEPYSFPISHPDRGENIVCVEPGRICVERADCPDQVCVKQGFISGGTVPIACLPHKLLIRIEGGGNPLDTAG